MDTFDFSPWFFVVVIGMIALGVAIAYGIMRNHNRTAEDRALTEAATHHNYHPDER
jgi:hypothetical protein